MTIQFACEHCGHHLRADRFHAGRNARCSQCGQTVRVPGDPSSHDETASTEPDSPADNQEFRLAPIEPDPAPIPRPGGEPSNPTAVEAANIDRHHPPTTGKSRKAKQSQAEEDAPRPGAANLEIMEDLIADRAPIPIDSSYEQARRDQQKNDPPWAIMNAKAHAYRSVRSILKKIEGVENWLYVVSLIFLMIAIGGLLLDYQPVAHFGAVWVTLSSILLAALGGIEVIIKPFQYGIFGTSWKTMKKQIRHALGAFLPLIVLIAAYFLIKPIRDYFLETAEARQAKQMSYFSAPTPVANPTVPPVIDHERIGARERA